MTGRYRILASFFALVIALAALAGCASDGDSTAFDTEGAAGDAEGDSDKADVDSGYEDEDHEDEDEDHDDHKDEEGVSLGAHEHGVAELSVAWSEGEMVVDLITPTYNVFGFEYEATTDEGVALVEERTEALTAPGVLAVNSEAGCTLADEVGTDLEYEGSHAELTASWLFACENPDEISELDATALFAEFPNLEDIDAQWASDSGQSSAELSPSSTVLKLG